MIFHPPGHRVARVQPLDLHGRRREAQATRPRCRRQDEDAKEAAERIGGIIGWWWPGSRREEEAEEGTGKWTDLKPGRGARA